jgi:hypothetical protein
MSLSIQTAAGRAASRVFAPARCSPEPARRLIEPRCQRNQLRRASCCSLSV